MPPIQHQEIFCLVNILQQLFLYSLFSKFRPPYTQHAFLVLLKCSFYSPKQVFSPVRVHLRNFKIFVRVRILHWRPEEEAERGVRSAGLLGTLFRFDLHRVEIGRLHQHHQLPSSVLSF